MIQISYRCGGCEAIATVDAPAPVFRSVTGRSYGIGSYEYPKIEDLAPEGWTAYDPIGCTYCPKCTQEIWPDAPVESPVVEGLGATHDR